MSTNLIDNDNRFHWNYFLALESDLQNISKFIEFTSENFNVFSIELTLLFLATASEVDVVAKQLCNLTDQSNKANNIVEYKNIIMPHFSSITETTINIPRFNLEFTPWNEWENDKSPQWWSDYNDVKHNRVDNFKKANLGNVLNSMAGLFTLVLMYYKRLSKEIKLNPIPCLYLAPISLAHQDYYFSGEICINFSDDEN